MQGDAEDPTTQTLRRWANARLVAAGSKVELQDPVEEFAEEPAKLAELLEAILPDVNLSSAKISNDSNQMQKLEAIKKCMVQR